MSYVNKKKTQEHMHNKLDTFIRGNILYLTYFFN